MFGEHLRGADGKRQIVLRKEDHFVQDCLTVGVRIGDYGATDLGHVPAVVGPDFGDRHLIFVADSLLQRPDHAALLLQRPDARKINDQM